MAWELERLETYSITSQRIVGSISSRDVWIRILPVQAEDADRVLLVECFRLAHPGPVTLLDPFRRVRIDPSIPHQPEKPRYSVQEYAVAMGLALRG